MISGVNRWRVKALGTAPAHCPSTQPNPPGGMPPPASADGTAQPLFAAAQTPFNSCMTCHGSGLPGGCMWAAGWMVMRLALIGCGASGMRLGHGACTGLYTRRVTPACQLHHTQIVLHVADMSESHASRSSRWCMERMPCRGGERGPCPAPGLQLSVPLSAHSGPVASPLHPEVCAMGAVAAAYISRLLLKQRHRGPHVARRVLPPCPPDLGLLGSSAKHAALRLVHSFSTCLPAWLGAAGLLLALAARDDAAQRRIWPRGQI